MSLDTMYTASQIDATRQPAQLERTRRMRDATQPHAHRPHLVRRCGALLSQAGAWLQGQPEGSLPAIVPVAEPLRTSSV